ncbi:MAG: hypothetical protein HYZ54_07370 [Ignavibacteriae bacterium]|nr:hypothetical protein [Ignavibacteriota bacterium]
MLKITKVFLLIFFIIAYSVNISNAQYDHNKRYPNDEEYRRVIKILPRSYKPKKGFVPDKETAIKIAEAIWFPIYGDRINHQRPFKAILNKKGNWEVRGTLPCEGQEGCRGGTAYAEIRKKDCRIIRVFHGK